MTNKLPPLNFEGEKEYDALSETTEVKFKRCKHKRSTMDNGELRCPCGAAWQGPNLHELHKKLTNR